MTISGCCRKCTAFNWWWRSIASHSDLWCQFPEEVILEKVVSDSPQYWLFKNTHTSAFVVGNPRACSALLGSWLLCNIALTSTVKTLDLVWLWGICMVFWPFFFQNWRADFLRLWRRQTPFFGWLFGILINFSWLSYTRKFLFLWFSYTG